MNQEKIGKVLTLGAIAVLVAALGIVLYAPEPSARRERAKFQKQDIQAKIAIKTAEEARDRDRSEVALRTWTGGATQIASTALSRVTDLTTKAGVKLTGFRPQRTNSDGPFVQLPFTATMEGPFGKVVEVARALEQPSSKLAVQLVQVSAAEEATDRVTATIGLVAFLAPKEESGG